MDSYLQNRKGTLIPATKRPDGTWRKARRVKDGYIPQEEVPLYESKGKQFAQRQNKMPPGLFPIGSVAAEKEKGKEERNKMKKAEETLQKLSIAEKHVQPTSHTSTQSSSLSNTILKQKPPKLKSTEGKFKNLDKSTTTVEIQLDNAKLLKKFRKKLREIEAIEVKIAAGESKKLDKDQIEKLKRKKEILIEIQIFEEEEKKMQDHSASNTCS